MRTAATAIVLVIGLGAWSSSALADPPTAPASGPAPAVTGPSAPASGDAASAAPAAAAPAARPTPPPPPPPPPRHAHRTRSSGSGERRVSDAQGLAAALQSAQGGDVIRLEPGSYGGLVYRNQEFETPVTITSADPKSPAVFDSIQLSNVGGMRITGVEISVRPKSKGVLIGQSSNLELDGLNVHGPSDAMIGGGAMLIRNSSGVRVTHTEVHDLNEGVAHLDCDHLVISDNTFHNMGADGIRGGGSSWVEVKGNQFSDFHRASGEHPDAIQFWTTNTKASAHDITIENNVFVRGEGTPAQGIFMADERRNLPYQNIRIAHNAMIGAMWNGIMIAHGDNVVITDNLVLGHPGMPSRIRVEFATNTELSHNETNSFHLANNGSGLSQKKNRTSPVVDPGDFGPLRRWLGSHPEVATNAIAALSAPAK